MLGGLPRTLESIFSPRLQFSSAISALEDEGICEAAPSPILSLAKMPSGLNAFEISEIQEEQTDAGPTGTIRM
jgi:hypothetical protein